MLPVMTQAVEAATPAAATLAAVIRGAATLAAVIHPEGLIPMDNSLNLKSRTSLSPQRILTADADRAAKAKPQSADIPPAVNEVHNRSAPQNFPVPMQHTSSTKIM